MLGKIFMNTLFESIPKEFYLLMFTRILVGEFEIWADEDCKRPIDDYDLVRILVSVIIPALLSNILRYSNVDFTFVPSILGTVSALITAAAMILTSAASFTSQELQSALSAANVKAKGTIASHDYIMGFA